MVKWFRKKPVEVQAVKFESSNSNEIFEFCPHAKKLKDEKRNEYFVIPTPEGERHLYRGDWVLRAPNGNYYKCEGDIMEEFYEEIRNE